MRQLLVVRHAIAEDAAEWARAHPDDAGRPLTSEGKKKMKRVADALCALVPDIQQLATSPLTRAVQTAEILAAAYDGLDPVVVPVLAPAQSPVDVTRWLAGERRHETVAIVGHEPGLSRVVSWLLAGSERSFVEIKKGAAVLLAFPDAVDAAAATLQWALTPSQLRGLE
ncbi:MAG TPA: histidine phosphatase family protein [Gemmatimonadales bacterium]|nr:histidine phosphatase family protein [Gemmatimonadales bacterium]